VDLVSVNASKGTCAEGETVVCDIGSLAGDESAIVKIKVKPERYGTLTNTATVFSTQTRDPETSNNSSTERTLTVAPPSAMTGAASGLTRNGATVRAFVDPGGVETAYRFEYGESASYGNTTPEQTLAAGFGPVSVEAAIGGLEPGKRYHYRIVATNRHDTSTGAGETFTTSPLTTTHLTQNMRPEATKPGQTIYRAGRLVAPREIVANRRVVLFQRVAGTSQFRPVRATRTGPAGAYVFQGLKPNRTTFYQVRFAGNAEDGLKASRSPVRRVVVRR
jgi:phosphodiesterase/alkaline phosphatase D-like protein